MSLGFSIGDFIAVFQLANRIRERFANAPEQFRAISNEVTGLSNVLRDIEGIFSSQGLTDWQEKALVPVLEECHNVLIALGKVVGENDCLKQPTKAHGIRNKTQTAWKKLTWKPDEIQELRSRVTLNTCLLNAFNGSLTSKVTLATKDGVDRLHERQDDREDREERRAILDWLTPVDYDAQQADFISRRQAGTGQWLLDSPEYQAWLETDKQTLFCPGIPGAGKTIITAIAVDDLCTKFRKDTSVGIAYIYCNFKRNREQNLEDLLLSLLKQLAQRRLLMPDPVKLLYSRHKDQRTRPSLDEISRALHDIRTLYSRTFIFVDALDECQVNNGCRTSFLSEIFDIQAKSSANLFATSRLIPEIIRRFEGNLTLEIRASPEDVQRFLDSHMSELPAFVGRNLELQEDIKLAIAEAIDGMFLLAQLYLNSLIGKRSPKAIKSALQSLRERSIASNKDNGTHALYNAYEEAMDRIEHQNGDAPALAKEVLAWITCAKRPLTTLELQHALAVEIGEPELDEDNLPEIEDMVSACAGLVTVDEESDIIRLVHYTTQEYFEQTQKRWFPDAETDITTTCITYLLFDTFHTGILTTYEEFVVRKQENPLYDYAVLHWGHHARLSSSENAQLILNLLQSTSGRSGCSQAIMYERYPWSDKIETQMTDLHLTTYFGLQGFTSALLGRGADIESKDQFNRTPLSYAAENGHEDIVKLLLDRDANIESKDWSDQTSLSYAAENNHEAIVELLLDRGANINSDDYEDYYQDYRTPLSLAAKKGHETIAKLLLDRGANVETNDPYGQTPLFYATENGHEAIVKLLLDRGANVESKDPYDQTPLSYAARYGHEAIVKLLLDRGANIESKDWTDRTPLSYAARNDREVIVKLLLDRGANIESKGQYNDRTPLAYAAENGHEAIVKLLLDRGANIESKDRYDWTPLSYAAANSHEAIVKLLLDRGANIESKDRHDRTPLSYAARYGNEGIVKLLLDRGANIESNDQYGWTPQYYAAQNRHEAIVKLLLDRGPNSADEPDSIKFL